jgi:ubiquinone/menaquinone biosynthesis C-methylase UbiE
MAARTTLSDAVSTDQAAVPRWDAAYAPSQLKGTNLWGDPPVPYAAIAAQLFAEAAAEVVLDLPCGDGRNLPPLAFGAPILIASDSSINAMGIAREVVTKAGAAGKTVFVKNDIFATTFLDDAIDGIFCWDMLGHLVNPADALRELHRICRPGGRIVANMWTMNDCQPQDPLIKKLAPREYVDHFGWYIRFYDNSDLEALLDTVGITAESVELQRWSEPPHVGYRDYEHEHECLILTIRKEPAS